MDFKWPAHQQEPDRLSVKHTCLALQIRSAEAARCRVLDAECSMHKLYLRYVSTHGRALVPYTGGTYQQIYTELGG